MTTPDQVAMYTTQDGKAHVRLQLKDNDAWLTQKQMADLFDVTTASVSHHIQSILSLIHI